MACAVAVQSVATTLPAVPSVKAAARVGFGLAHAHAATWLALMLTHLPQAARQAAAMWTCRRSKMTRRSRAACSSEWALPQNAGSGSADCVCLLQQAAA